MNLSLAVTIKRECWRIGEFGFDIWVRKSCPTQELRFVMRILVADITIEGSAIWRTSMGFQISLFAITVSKSLAV